MPEPSTSRRETILELAAELFARKGVAQTTVRDIGEAAGILSGSLYYHFDSKETIIQEIVERHLAALVEAYRAVLDDADSEPRARLEGLVLASFEAIDERRHSCEIFQNDFTYIRSLPQRDVITALGDEVQRIWLDTITAGAAAGVFRDDIDPKLFYRFSRDAVWFAVRWYHSGGTHTPAQLSAAFTALVLDGLVCPSVT